MNISLDVYNFDNLKAKDYAEGGRFYPSADKFPGCSMLFHQDDLTDGDTVWVDRITGRTLTSAVATTFKKGDNGIYQSGAGVCTLTNPTTLIGAVNDFVLLHTGLFAASSSSLTLGDTGSNDVSFDLKGGDNGWVIRSYPANENAPSVLSGLTYPAHAMGVQIDRSADSTRKSGANSGGIVDTVVDAVNAGTFLGSWATMAGNIGISISRSGGHKMICLFEFDAPIANDELEAAITWMAVNPDKIYPGWAGRA